MILTLICDCETKNHYDENMIKGQLKKMIDDPTNQLLLKCSICAKPLGKMFVDNMFKILYVRDYRDGKLKQIGYVGDYNEQ